MLLLSLCSSPVSAPNNPLFQEVGNISVLASLTTSGTITSPQNDLEGELWEMAVKYGIEEEYDKMLQVLKCESGLDNSKIGKYGEVGIAQFLPSTWVWFNKIRETDLDIYNEQNQLELFGWAIKSGYQNQWVCWNYDY